MLGFDVELEAGDWPRGGRGREGSSGACSLVLEGEETTSPMSASKPNPRDASPSQRRGKRIKGGETPPKSSIGHSCAHIFSETSFARPLATRLVVEPTRARAQNNRLRAFASRRVHLSSRARLVSKRSPPAFFSVKNLFLLRRKFVRERRKKRKQKKKTHSFARRALFGNAAPRHANKKKERKRKGRTHRYSIGWKGRTEQSWGWSRTCFFSSSFCCVRVKMCEVPFFLFRRKKEK